MEVRKSPRKAVASSKTSRVLWRSTGDGNVRMNLKEKKIKINLYTYNGALHRLPTSRAGNVVLP
jgi:hypothetical protein